MTIAEQITRAKTDYDKVYEAGKKSEYDAFWDSFQKKGVPIGYTYKFYGEHWSDEVYKPKYDIVCTAAISAFYSSSITDSLVSIDCRDIAMQTTFAYCNIQTIRKLIVSKDTTYSRTFDTCKKIINLTIEGVIGKNGFNVQWATLLTHDSLMSIINALADYSKDTSEIWTVTIGETNRAKLTDDELAIAEMKGWEVA